MEGGNKPNQLQLTNVLGVHQLQVGADADYEAQI